MRASLALLALASAPVLARENATSAFQVFRLKDCEECILDEDSVWCSEGSGFIRNATLKVTLGVNPDNGELEVPEYCWEGTSPAPLRQSLVQPVVSRVRARRGAPCLAARARASTGTICARGYIFSALAPRLTVPCLPCHPRAGTFGKLLKAQGNFTGQFNSPEWVVADLECDGMKLYYNQCIGASRASICEAQPPHHKAVISDYALVCSFSWPPHSAGDAGDHPDGDRRDPVLRCDDRCVDLLRTVSVRDGVELGLLPEVLPRVVAVLQAAPEDGDDDQRGRVVEAHGASARPGGRGRSRDRADGCGCGHGRGGHGESGFDSREDGWEGEEVGDGARRACVGDEPDAQVSSGRAAVSCPPSFGRGACERMEGAWWRCVARMEDVSEARKEEQ